MKNVIRILCLTASLVVSLSACSTPAVLEDGSPLSDVTAAPEVIATAAPEKTEAPTAKPTHEPAVEEEQIDPLAFATPAPDARYTLENFPIIDGSLANVPLVDLLTMRMLGVDAATASALTMSNFSNTNPSYISLCEGRAQLVLAYEPSQDTVAMMEDMGAKLEQAEIGRDALVFLTGKDNPVDSLTMDQLIGIYTGSITNWSQVGGNDAPIVAYQRREDSGSQTLMRKLVMKDTPMAAPPTEQVIEEMGELIDVIAAFDGDNNSIGFSVYYYAANMYASDSVKMIAVDGVAPSNETIESGKYTLVNPFYATIRQDAAADSPEREIFEWLLGDEGTELIREAGYVPAGRE